MFNYFCSYPSDKYIEYLESEMTIVHLEDIDCTDLFADDKREIIAIYKI